MTRASNTSSLTPQTDATLAVVSRLQKTSPSPDLAHTILQRVAHAKRSVDAREDTQRVSSITSTAERSVYHRFLRVLRQPAYLLREPLTAVTVLAIFFVVNAVGVYERITVANAPAKKDAWITAKQKVGIDNSKRGELHNYKSSLMRLAEEYGIHEHVTLIAEEDYERR